MRCKNQYCPEELEHGISFDGYCSLSCRKADTTIKRTKTYWLLLIAVVILASIAVFYGNKAFADQHSQGSLLMCDTVEQVEKITDLFYNSETSVTDGVDIVNAENPKEIGSACGGAEVIYIKGDVAQKIDTPEGEMWIMRIFVLAVWGDENETGEMSFEYLDNPAVQYSPFTPPPVPSEAI